MIDINDIEDSALRDQITSLGMTLPHPDTVIDPLIEEFQPQLYYKLLAMEAYTYDHSGQVDYVYYPIEEPDPANGEVVSLGLDNGWYQIIPAEVPQYQPGWQSLSNAIMSYLSSPSVDKGTLKDFFLGLYCFLSVHVGKGFGPASILAESDAKGMFIMGGYVDTAAGYDLAYYDDYVAPIPTPPSDDEGDGGTTEPPPDPSAGTGEHVPKGTTAKLLGDAGVIPTYYDTDSGKIEGLIAKYGDVVTDASIVAIFSNPTPPQVVMTPTYVWDTVFITLNWQWYVEYFNAPFTIPPRPEELMPPADEEP